MQLVKLTVYKRNETILNVEGAFDVDDLVSPIRLNANSKSYFDYMPKSPKANIPVSYQTDESLSSIVALDNKLILLTVLKRRGEAITVGGVTVASEDMIFNVSKISEALVTTVLGTRFFYMENYPEQIEYEVSDSIDDIIAQTDTGPGTGTVTRVSVDSLSPLFTATMGTATTQPVIHFFSPTQGVNKFYAGPTSGTGTTASFRVIDVLDLPATAKNLVSPQGAGQVLAGPTGATAPSGYPSFRMLVNLDFPLEHQNLVAGQNASLVLAGPSGPTAPSAAATFRSLVVTDLPATAQNILAVQGHNQVLAGPTGQTAPSAAPSFRLMDGNDLPLTTITGPSSSPTAGTNVALKITINGQDYFIQARQ